MRVPPLVPALAIAVLVASPIQAQTSSDYASAARPGDAALSCAQIKAEGMEAQGRTMAQATADLPPEVDAKIQATAKAGAATASALSLAATASRLTSGSRLADTAFNQGIMASGRATQMAIQSQVRAAQAEQDAAFDASLDRMSYLQALYREKCL